MHGFIAVSTHALFLIIFFFFLFFLKGVESLALINICSYAGGTNPWGTKKEAEGFEAPRMDDGMIEVDNQRGEQAQKKKKVERKEESKIAEWNVKVQGVTAASA